MEEVEFILVFDSEATDWIRYKLYKCFQPNSPSLTLPHVPTTCNAIRRDDLIGYYGLDPQLVSSKSIVLKRRRLIFGNLVNVSTSEKYKVI